MSEDTTVTGMTGAQALVSTLANNGVDVCFANPGTSEMHLVTALDGESRIKSVLCLFEGIATGAADGYARVAGKPAMTLLHLGAGYLNAGANIHNAKRGHTPMINVIGDHATYHLKYEAPLTSDIMGLAAPNSIWIKRVSAAGSAGTLAAEAYAASFGPLSGPVSLILPADSAWDEGGQAGPNLTIPTKREPDPTTIRVAADALKTAEKPALIINGTALLGDGLVSAGRLKAAGVRVLTDTFYSIMERGAGRYLPERMQYFAEGAMADLDGVDLMLIAGTQVPAAFFAYPGKPSVLVPEGCTPLSLCDASGDSAAALAALADAIGATEHAPAQQLALPDRPAGKLDAFKVGAAITRHLPEDAVVADDGVSNGFGTYMATETARPHRWMMLTGGAIGYGMPAAVGAALGAPESPVLCITGDGAGMYTNQALWTMARENLNAVTVVFVNHTYRILQIELYRTGAGNPGPAANSMLTLGNPEIDWAQLAASMGVTGHNAHTGEELDALLETAFAEGGPHLIAAHLPG
ncbi:MAG: acetolactate synthase large subunit [Pseudomonadota bacterium]